MFAESFREMLDRNNAFAVYHNLHCYLDRESERKRRDEALAATEEAPKTEESTDVDAEKEKEAKEVPKKEATKEDSRTKFKALVNHVNAFTSFAHFDQNTVG